LKPEASNDSLQQSQSESGEGLSVYEQAREDNIAKNIEAYYRSIVNDAERRRNKNYSVYNNHTTSKDEFTEIMKKIKKLIIDENKFKNKQELIYSSLNINDNL
jgi:hypothetical protein